MYMSVNISPELKVELIQLLEEFNDCFAWDYDEMSSLSGELFELKLPINYGKKPIKQTLRRFAPEVLSKIKEEVERFSNANSLV